MRSSAFKLFTGRQLLAVAVVGYVLASVAPPPARAGTIAFNDFGPNFSYISGGSTISPFFTQGSQFQSSAAGMLTDVEAAVQYSNPPPPDTSFTLSLYADNGGTLGSLLAASGGSAGPQGSVTDVQFPAGPNLVAGNKYWLIASSSNSLFWSPNNQGVTGVNYYHDGFGSTQYNPGSLTMAFEAFVAVPEPPAALLALGGLFVCGSAVTIGKLRRGKLSSRRN